jgi:hypothetical protein
LEKELPITLQSIEKSNLRGPQSPGWLVKFIIDRGDVSFEFPTFVPTEVLEEHVVDVARNHLILTFQAIAAQRVGWIIPEADKDKYLVNRRP